MPRTTSDDPNWQCIGSLPYIPESQRCHYYTKIPCVNKQLAFGEGMLSEMNSVVALLTRGLWSVFWKTWGRASLIGDTQWIQVFRKGHESAFEAVQYPLGHRKNSVAILCHGNRRIIAEGTEGPAASGKVRECAVCSTSPVKMSLCSTGPEQSKHSMMACPSLWLWEEHFTPGGGLLIF